MKSIYRKHNKYDCTAVFEYLISFVSSMLVRFHQIQGVLLTDYTEMFVHTKRKFHKKNDLTLTQSQGYLLVFLSCFVRPNVHPPEMMFLSNYVYTDCTICSNFHKIARQHENDSKAGYLFVISLRVIDVGYFFHFTIQPKRYTFIQGKLVKHKKTFLFAKILFLHWVGTIQFSILFKWQ